MKKFAAFDIDGTLIRWQLYHAVVDRLAKKNRLGPNAAQQLHQSRMRWKRREHAEAFREYELELVSIYEAALETLSPAEFDKATQEVIDEYIDQTYVYTRQLIKELKAKGYVLLAISGSHRELVEHIAKTYGFDHWVGSEYKRTDDNRYSGEIMIHSLDKRQVLTRLIKEHGLGLKDSLAIGDSASDAAMLEMVEQPIAFNPDQKLFQLAKQHGWKIVIERKNVIYELEPNDGRYILA